MARDFTGSTSNYLSHAAGGTIADSFPISMACWFNADSFASNGFLVSMTHYEDGDKGDYLTLRFFNNTVTAGLYQTNLSGVNISATAAATTGTWHHGTVVFTSSSLAAAYLNGANKGTGTPSRTPAPLTTLSVGALVRSGNVSAPVDTRIAEAAIWTAALTDAEAAILAAGASPLTVRPANLLTYWPLVGRFSPETDRIGGYDLTLTGTVNAADHPRVVYPAAAQLTRVIQGTVTVRLTWTDNSGDEDGFSIERSRTSATAGFSEVGTAAANATQYNDSSGLLSGTTYWYRVRAYRGSVYSDYSPVVEITTT